MTDGQGVFKTAYCPFSTIINYENAQVRQNYFRLFYYLCKLLYCMKYNPTLPKNNHMLQLIVTFVNEGY